MLKKKYLGKCWAFNKSLFMGYSVDSAHPHPPKLPSFCHVFNQFPLLVGEVVGRVEPRKRRNEAKLICNQYCLQLLW